MKKYHEFILVSLGIIVLIAWFFKDALFHYTIFVERDLSRYYYPLRYFASACIKSGVFPLWNPYIFCGNPLFASLQSCVLYPPSIIYYLGNFAAMFNVFIAFHFFVAGISTYIFSRQIRCSIIASIMSAVTFCFSGYLVSVVNLLTTLSVVAWFPLAMLFYYRMIKNINSGQKSFKDSLMLGVVLTIMFLGGEPSLLYLVIGLFFLGALYFTLEEFTGGSLHAKKKFFNFNYIKNILYSIVIFLGLSSFQLLPFLEFLKNSNRDKVSFEMASTWNLPIKDIPGIILPFFHDVFVLFSGYWSRQSWLDNYYVGLIVFLLFLIAVFFDRSKKARAIFILGLLGFVVSLGKDTALFEFLFNYLPGFKVMRYTVRFFFIPTFAFCVLAGIGLDYYIRRAKDNPGFKKAAVFLFALAFVSSIFFYILNSNPDKFLGIMKTEASKLAWKTSLPRTRAEGILSSEIFLKFISADLINLKRAFLLLSIFGLLFYLGLKKGVRANIFIAPCFAFLAISDILIVNENFNPLLDLKTFTSPHSNIRYVTKEYSRLHSAYPNDANRYLFRICCSPKVSRDHMYVPEKDFFKGLEASKDRLIPNRMVPYGIYDINMYGSIYISRNSKFMNLVMEKKSKNLKNLLEILNVRYIAADVMSDDFGFKLVNKTPATNLFEIKKYAPRAFLAQKAVVITDEKKILDKLKEGDFKPRQEVILEEYLQLPPAGENVLPQEAVETVRILTYTPNKIMINATVTKKPKFLVLTDTYYPGWKVFVDGKIKKILKADYMFRAVYLEPGTHSVQFVYDPSSFKIGIFVTLATIAIIVLLTFIL